MSSKSYRVISNKDQDEETRCEIAYTPLIIAEQCTDSKTRWKVSTAYGQSPRIYVLCELHTKQMRELTSFRALSLYIEPSGKRR